MITTVFFDLHGTLIDTSLLAPCYTKELAALLSERYGGEREAYEEANRRIMADWSSYLEGLDFDGPDGLAHLRESRFRSLYAHFKMVGVRAPARDEMARLVDEYPYLVTRHCDAAYPEAKHVLSHTAALGLKLSVATNANAKHTRGVLEGAGLFRYFNGPLFNRNMAGKIGKDEAYFAAALKLAGEDPAACVVVDDNSNGIIGAREAGARTVLIDRADRRDARPLDWGRAAAEVVLPDLTGLTGLFERWLNEHD